MFGRLADSLNGEASTYSLANVEQILITGGGKNDRINVADDVMVDTWISGGPGKDIIQGGGGDDLIRGDAGRDKINGGGGENDLAANSRKELVAVRLLDSPVVAAAPTSSNSDATDEILLNNQSEAPFPLAASNTADTAQDAGRQAGGNNSAEPAVADMSLASVARSAGGDIAGRTDEALRTPTTIRILTRIPVRTPTQNQIQTRTARIRKANLTRTAVPTATRIRIRTIARTPTAPPIRKATRTFTATRMKALRQIQI